MLWNETSRMAGISLLADALACLSPGILQAQSQKQFRGSENFGLRGPVHTVVESSKSLDPDPRRGQHCRPE
jgi:hypothetical protein